MKRLLGFFSVILISLFSLTACTENKVSKIQADVPITEYEIGQVLDLSGAKLKIYYVNLGQEVIDLEYSMISTYDIINMYAYGTIGEKSIGVSYIDGNGDVHRTTFTVTIVDNKFKASAKADINNALINVNNTTYSETALAEITLRREGAISSINSANTEEEAKLIADNFIIYLRSVKTLELEQGEAILNEQIKESFVDITYLQDAIDEIETYNEEVEAIIALLGVNSDQTKLQALEDLKEAIKTANDELATIAQRLEEIDEEAIQDAVEAVEGISAELTTLKASVATLETKVAALEALDLPAVKAKVDAMEQTIASQLEAALAGYVKASDIETLLSDKLSGIKAEWISEIVETVLGEIKPTDVAFKVENGYIQWTVDGQTWNNLIALSEISGEPLLAKEIELRAEGDYIQWKYVGEEQWNNLIALAAITGPSGQDGKKVELQANEDWIQWRYEGDENWVNLIQVSIASSLVSIEIEVIEGVLKFKQNAAEWVDIIDLNEFVSSIVDNRVVNIEGAVQLLDEKITELQKQFNGLSDYNDELAQEIASVKQYLTSIGLNLDSTTDLATIISSQVLTVIDSIIEQYLANETGAANIIDFVAYVKGEFNRIKDIRSTLVTKMQDFFQTMSSSEPLSNRVRQALEILLDNDDLYRLLNVSEETIAEINISFNEFRTAIVAEIKGKVANLFGLLVVPEYYSVTAFLEKYGSTIGEFSAEISESIQYEKLEEVTLLVTEAQDLIKTIEMTNPMDKVARVVEIYETIQRIDTIHEVTNAFFATKLEEAYQQIISLSNASGVPNPNAHSIFMVKETYKNRILTTKSLLTGAELYQEAMVQLEAFL